MDISTMQVRQTYQSEVTEECIAERRLWLAVIALAMEDWRFGTLRARREAQKFLFDDAEDFANVCARAGLDAANLRSRLAKIGRKIALQGPWEAPLAA
ncbi:MAG TPA: hypothetical protein VEJ46_08275 [Candidatus Acidoferrum sp.]|nr:hypothetical protein [Candidatus Acidoferrum sp.]